MALESSEERGFEDDFEFDAPQWIDLGEETQLENDSNSERYDWWFQKIHPLHSPEDVSTESEPKKQPPRKSILGFGNSKLSSESCKTSLPSKSSVHGTSCKTSSSGKPSLFHKTSSSGKTSFSGKSSFSKQDLENKGQDLAKASTTNQEADVKKPRKCWQLNGQTALSFSPRPLTKDLQPKRGSSNSVTWSLLPGRSSNEVVSPLVTISPSKKIKHKALKATRRSCPQKLQKSRQTWNESSTKSKKSTDDVDEELQKIIDEHNRKILGQQSQYDLNGRKIRKTASSPLKATKENTKPAVATKLSQHSKEIDDELQRLIDNHNRKIWSTQNSKYDLNGRRVRRSNVTVTTAPTKSKAEPQTSMVTRSKSLRRSAPQETNQKRKTPASYSKPSEAPCKKSTVTSENQPQRVSTDIENEIQEIVNLHNSRLAAKKAKK